MLGLSPERQEVAVKSPRLTVEATDPGAGVAVALKNRLDYAQIISDCQDAARGVRIADRNLLPDLRMISRFQKVGEGDAASDSLQLDDHAWFAGLSLVSDFPMRAESDALQQAEINRRVAEIRVDAVRAAIERQVRQALLSYERVRSELALAEENYRLAQKRARLARRLFDRVNNDSFSVSEAEDELREAEGLWLSAEAAASTEAYRLLRVLGTLIDSPADLKPKAGA
jgi:outer membrane protein TolC